MRICIVKETGRIIGMQSAAPAGLLTANAKIEFGLDKDAVEEKEVTEAEYIAAKAKDPIFVAQNAAIASKEKDISDNLPSWKEVSDAIDGVTTIAGLRGVVKKLARVVYWLAKNKAE